MSRDEPDMYLFVLQDVSLLLDLCRQCIVFERVEDLVECLRLIHADPLVQVVQVPPLCVRT